MLKLFKYIFLLLEISLYSIHTYGISCVDIAVPNEMQGTVAHYLQDQIIVEAADCNSTDKTFAFCWRHELGGNCRSKFGLSIDQKQKIASISSPSSNVAKISQLKDVEITLSLSKDNNLCLMVDTIYGPYPIACRSSNGVDIQNIENGGGNSDVCSMVSNSCYATYSSHSQSMFSLSGKIVHCLQETLAKIFYTQNSCSSAQRSITQSIIAPFPVFHKALRGGVFVALTISVILFGLKIVMSQKVLEANKVISYLLKFMLVVYFAVGFGQVGSDGVPKTGMTEFGLPLLNNIATEFSDMMLSASGSTGLCKFDESKYKQGYKFYALWDGIDCRISYYLGLGFIYNFIAGGKAIFSSGGAISSIVSDAGISRSAAEQILLSTLAVPYVAVMMSYFLAGNILIFISGLVFLILFLSMILNFISVFLVSMITMHVLVYISPIFIPMALFEKTKSYYKMWLKLVISSVLQPAIVMAFIGIMLTIYDSAIYGNCVFNRHEYSFAGISDVVVTTFELALPQLADVSECKNSPGYKLLAHYLGVGWKEYSWILFPVYGFLDILNMIESMAFLAVLSVIFYFFSKSITQFSAEITNGMDMSKVTISPTKIIDKAKDIIDDRSSKNKADQQSKKL